MSVEQISIESARVGTELLGYRITMGTRRALVHVAPKSTGRLEEAPAFVPGLGQTIEYRVETTSEWMRTLEQVVADTARELGCENDNEKILEAIFALKRAVGAQLEPVSGDVLPAIGSDVLIHHASDNAWHPCTVAGFYAWPSLQGDETLQRLFVRVVYKNSETPNARLLQDVRRVDGTPFVTAGKPHLTRTQLLDELAVAWAKKGDDPEVASRRIRARHAIERAWGGPTPRFDARETGMLENAARLASGNSKQAGDHWHHVEQLLCKLAAQGEPAPVSEPDPCPACTKGGVCRSPRCGRLIALNIAAVMRGAP